MRRPNPVPTAAPSRRRAGSPLARLLGGLATAEGIVPTQLADVRLMHSRGIHARGPVCYDPSIVIIAQGCKHGKLGGQTFTYDARHYLVLAVPLPFECETVGTPDEPMLGLAIRVNPVTVAELLLELDSPGPATPPSPPSLGVAALTSGLSEAAVRLARCLGSPVESRVLGSQIVREITYHALRGGQGAALRALATPRSHLHQIARSLRRIHQDYAGTLGVSALAREAGMSVSTFHASFKAVTAKPPLRYLQTIRLHRARVLLSGGTPVAEAGRRVGYGSASQFSREFKRLFGDSPRVVTRGSQTGSFTF